MRRYRSLATLLVAAVAIASPTLFADDKPLEGDAKKLQGKWTTKAGPDSTPVFLVFDKDAVSITYTLPSGDEVKIAGKFKIDDAVTPKLMDWKEMKAADRDLPDNPAIYAFEGDDELKIAGAAGKERPKEFVEKGKQTGDARANALVFKRVKDEPKK